MESFKLIIKKEIIIYLGLLLVLAFLAHGDLLTHPSSRFQSMIEKENYSHPFLYAFFVYSVFFVIRKVLDFFIGLFEK